MNESLLEAAERIVTEYDRYGEVLQVADDDDNGTYGPNSAIEMLRAAVERENAKGTTTK